MRILHNDISCNHKFMKPPEHKMEGGNPQIKVIMLGDSAVGKTTLVGRWCDDKYSSNHQPTIGAAFKKLTIEMEEGKQYDLVIWDTAGQETYREQVALFCRDANAAMIVFNVTIKETFQSLPHWIEHLRKSGDIPFVIVGNKIDLDNRQVSFDEAMSFAASYNVPYFDTSAFTSYNVDEAFTDLSHMACDTFQKKPSVETIQGTDIEKPKPQVAEKKGGCC